MVDITDTSTTLENASFMLVGVFFFNFLIYLVLYPSSDFLMFQILPKETPMQDREPDSPLIDPTGIEGGLVAVTLKLLIPGSTNNRW